jgi:hypothetical protein
MHTFITLNRHLTLHRLDVRVKATVNTHFDAWIGAVIRNNLLYAAGQIQLPEHDISLYQYCTGFPLAVDHPLSKELKDGFPTPYYLFVPSEQHPTDMRCLLENEELTFSLILTENIARYFTCFIQAIRFMCSKGFGIDSKPFTLIDVREVSAMGENRLLSRGAENLSDKLIYPIRFEDFQTRAYESQENMRIVFESPVCLIRPKRKTETAGFQEKSNAFPGFYQFVRTAAYRLEKLHALYAMPDEPDNYLASHACVDSYIEPSARMQLEKAAIQKTYLLSSQRTNRNINRIPLSGYMGEMIFSGNFKPYLPLLKFMELLGVGHELSYGFGKFRIK